MKWENKNKRKLGPLGTINQLWCVSNIIIGYDEHSQIHEYPSMLMRCVRLCDFHCFLFLNWLLIWNFCFFFMQQVTYINPMWECILFCVWNVFIFLFYHTHWFYPGMNPVLMKKKNKFMHIPWIMNQWSFASHRIVYGKKWPSIWFNLHPPTHTHTDGFFYLDLFFFDYKMSWITCTILWIAGFLSTSS